MKHICSALLALPLAALCLGGCGASADVASAPAATTAPALQGSAATSDYSALDARLQRAVESGEVIGVSALVFDEGVRVYEKSFGLADREAGRAVDNDTIWRIYSMTKPITSALIMDLEEDGLLSITDPVSKYIPELANMKVVSAGADGAPVYTDQAKPMTVEDLLLHRSGMAYGIFGGNPVEDAYGAAQLFKADEGLAPKMERLAQLPLLFQPGDAWFYSYSIDVLGRIAEVVAGKPLDELMAERFFEPLGMDDTGFFVRPDGLDRLAALYQLQPDGSYIRLKEDAANPFLPDRTVDNAFHSGGGGLLSTQGDYARFAQMILDGGVHDGRRYLEEATVARMTSDQMEPGFRSVLPWLGGDTGVGFGYGGSVQVTATEARERDAGRYPGQWGWGGAARTNMFVDPQNNSFGIIMLQFFGGEDPQIHDDFQALVLEQVRDD